MSYHIWPRLIAICFGLFVMTSTVTGQDFLKQLEEKLRGKPIPETKESQEPSPASDEEQLPSPTDNPQGTPGATNPFRIPDSRGSDSTEPSLPKVSPKSSTERRSNSAKDPIEPRMTGPANSRKTPAPPRVNPPRTAESQKLKASASSAIAPAPNPTDPKQEGYFLGLTADQSPGNGPGLVVVDVTQGSPAWKAGFQIGDRILAIDGHAVSNLDFFDRKLSESPLGEPVRFLVSRAGRNRDVVAILQSRKLAAMTIPAVPGRDGAWQDDGTQRRPIPNSMTPAFLGISMVNLSDGFRKRFAIPAYRGAAVTEVAEGSPADRAGIRAGDCIVEVDGQVIQSAKALQEWIESINPSQVANISFYRGQGLNQTQVVLSPQMPQGVDPGMDRWISGNDLPDHRNADASQLPQIELVQQMQIQIEQLRQELEASQLRIQQLEQRLQLLEVPNAFPEPLQEDSLPDQP